MASAAYTLGHAQRNGRRYVAFTVTLDDGTVVRTGDRGPIALPEDEQERTAVLDALAAKVLSATVEDAAEAEFRSKRGVIAPLNLQHQTGAQFAARVRERYREASRERAAEIAWWVVEMIGAGHLTDAQVRNAFGLTVQQYATLKAKLETAHDAWAVALSAEGE